MKVWGQNCGILIRKPKDTNAGSVVLEVSFEEGAVDAQVKCF